MGFFAGDAFDDEADEATRWGEEGDDFLPVFVIEAAEDEAFMGFFQWHLFFLCGILLEFCIDSSIG